MPVARLASTALDCSDPAALAAFWAALVGGEVAFTSDEFCAVKTDHGWLATVRVEDYRQPSWPDPAVPKQLHLDLAVNDLDAAEAKGHPARRDPAGCSAGPGPVAGAAGSGGSPVLPVEPDPGVTAARITVAVVLLDPPSSTRRMWLTSPAIVISGDPGSGANRALLVRLAPRTWRLPGVTRISARVLREQ